MSRPTPTTDVKELLTDREQAFGKSPEEVRESDHYQHEYVPGFVDKWDELIDWDARAESEGTFFAEILRARGKHQVLDVATGTGFHSVQLIKQGFDVTSADGNPAMLAKAFDNGRKVGHVLTTVPADWRWLNKDVHNKFDAIVCLGNSFTHLFDESDRRRALAEFYAALKYDGILILDQRNYDSILDDGFSSKHTYYYCGDQVSAEPEYVDDGLARFKYSFPDESEYHLNMFPLRKEYTRGLMLDAGFQHIDTYGDFQETYQDAKPDFFIHVAEKTHGEFSGRSLDVDGTAGTIKVAEPAAKQAERVAEEYYDSDDADNFYFELWGGGEDIHIGLYEAGMPVRDASRRTVAAMAGLLDRPAGTKVLDLGAGYGGSARYMAEKLGWEVTCLNISEVQNERNRQNNAAAGLSDKVDVLHGSFEDVPADDDSFDVVWSQDAFLHSGQRETILDEIERVLKPGGDVVFTDPMQADECPDGVLDPILARIHLDTLASPAFYRRGFAARGFGEQAFAEHTDQLGTHYGTVRAELLERRDEISTSDEYIDRMLEGLQHWVDGAKNGYLAWGIFHFRAAD